MMKKWMIYTLLVTLLCTALVACGAEQPAAEEPQTTAGDTTQTTGTTEPQLLSEEEVKTFALFCAGTTEKKVTNYQCTLTYHQERECQVYEIVFDVGRAHFEYIFRATDCDIIKNEKTICEE